MKKIMAVLDWAYEYSTDVRSNSIIRYLARPTAFTRRLSSSFWSSLDIFPNRLKITEWCKVRSLLSLNTEVFFNPVLEKSGCAASSRKSVDVNFKSCCEDEIDAIDLCINNGNNESLRAKRSNLKNQIASSSLKNAPPRNDNDGTITTPISITYAIFNSRKFLRQSKLCSYARVVTAKLALLNLSAFARKICRNSRDLSLQGETAQNRQKFRLWRCQRQFCLIYKEIK